MSKKIILIIGIFVIIGGGFLVYQKFIREKPVDFVLEKVVRGDVYQEVVETGKVEPIKEVDLSFKKSGKIEKIYVNVGDNVRINQKLASIDASHLIIQLDEAKAILQARESQYDKLLAGARIEEVRIAETTVSNAEIAVKAARQKLEDVKILAENSLNQAFQNALNSLRASYLILNSAFRSAESIQETYFFRNDHEGIRVRKNKNLIQDKMIEARFYLDIANNNPIKENIDIALLKMENALRVTSDSLMIIREMCEISIYKHAVTDAHRTLLETERTKINNSRTSIINSKQSISSIKAGNRKTINAAEFQVSLAQETLKKAQDQLALLITEPRQQDIDLHKAQIKQIKAQISLLENQIQETTIRSPINGRVVKIDKEIGEMILAGSPLISIISDDELQINVHIYEEDIVKVNLGDLVNIELVAFPDKVFVGKVISIDPTEKLIDGVVHYETIIAFIQKPPKGIKPGMTADIAIKTAFREDVLVIPEDAIQERDDKFIVQIFKDGEIQEREIEIGLKGEDGRVEIISGLEQGEQVVVK